MKKNVKMIAFAIAVCAVSALNVKIMIDTEHAKDMMATTLAAIGEGGPGESGEGGEGGGYPSDPFAGQGTLVDIKRVENYDRRSYNFSFRAGEDKYYYYYTIPVTQVICIGIDGYVKCVPGIYAGNMVYRGIVENPDLNNTGEPDWL